MPVMSVRVSWKTHQLIVDLASNHDVKLSDVLRDAVHSYLQGEHEGLEHIANEAKIAELVHQLDFLDKTQRKMLRSGAFLAKSLPKDWSPAKRWATVVKGEEREALELLLGEREYLAQEIAARVKATYRRRANIMLLDRPPWYKITAKTKQTKQECK
jgi:hypothetical protein